MKQKKKHEELAAKKPNHSAKNSEFDIERSRCESEDHVVNDHVPVYWHLKTMYPR